MSGDEVQLEHDDVSVVPAAFFDELIAERDEEPRPNPALARAAQRARNVVVQH